MTKPSVHKELPNRFDRMNRGILGLSFLLMSVSFFINSTHAMNMVFVSFIFAISLSLGVVFVLALEDVTGAFWSIPIRRVVENLSAILPLSFLLGLIPLFLMEHSTFFTVRELVLFLIWIFLWSSLKKNKKFSYAFMIFLGPALTLFSADWLMSLVPHWNSTLLGVYFFAGIAMSGFALVTLLIVPLFDHGFLHPKMKRHSLLPLGMFLFAFNAFWCYIAYSQFMLIWYGNIPEETAFFKMRWEGSWVLFSSILILVHFPIPFFGLISRSSKTNSKSLLFFSSWLILAEYLDVVWLIMPSISLDSNSTFSVLQFVPDLGFPLFIGAGIVWVFIRQSSHFGFLDFRTPNLQQGLDWNLEDKTWKE